METVTTEETRVENKNESSPFQGSIIVGKQRMKLLNNLLPLSDGEAETLDVFINGMQ